MELSIKYLSNCHPGQSALEKMLGRTAANLGGCLWKHDCIISVTHFCVVVLISQTYVTGDNLIKFFGSRKITLSDVLTLQCMPFVEF